MHEAVNALLLRDVVESVVAVHARVLGYTVEVRDARHRRLDVGGVELAVNVRYLFGDAVGIEGLPDLREVFKPSYDVGAPVHLVPDTRDDAFEFLPVVLALNGVSALIVDERTRTVVREVGLFLRHSEFGNRDVCHPVKEIVCEVRAVAHVHAEGLQDVHNGVVLVFSAERAVEDKVQARDFLSALRISQRPAL